MAIGVSQAFKDAMQAPVKVLRATVTVDEQVFTSANQLISFSVESSGYYFGAVTKMLDFSLLGTTYNLVGKYAHVVIEVQTDATNDTWAACDLGNFYISEQDAKLEKETTSFKAYDKVGVLAHTYYVGGGLSFPCTIEDLVEQFKDKFGLDYTSTTLVNGSHQIAEDLYEKINNITYRDILAEIAGATATLASIDGEDDVLSFREPAMVASETWTYDNLKSIKYEPKYGEINSVVLSRMPQEDNIAVRDEDSITQNGLTELKLANNELLDDDRESMAQPILDAVDGFWFYPFEANTEGHGWHECGDRISVTDGTNTWEVIVTYVKITIDGGMKELVKGVRPTADQTNYALAGGIMKTIYNTEIKVDKQGQEITSVVSRQDQFENQTLENFTQVVQNINSVVTTIQTTGGGNLIHNSVGYNVDTDHTLINWTQSGTISSESSPESLSYGAISGNQINLRATSSIIQRITVDGSGNQPYTLSLKAKKGATGVATIHLRNTIDDYIVTIPEGESVLWKSYSIVGVQPHASYFDVVIETNNAVTELSITDLMLSVGDSTTPWVSATDEILSKNVAVDGSGVTVRSNSTNDYTQLNELGLNGYSDASGIMKNVFTVNRDTTEVEKLKSRGQISMPPIKIVPITSGSRAGWSFVAES